MKTAVYFKHFLSAFAALVLLGVASSCKDQNFDWDNVHSLSSVEKFTDTFIKEYGKPADGHQWGFDYIWNKTEDVATTRSMYVYKPESENMARIISYYGPVKNISKQEHFEVREWFSKHKVEWDHTTYQWGNVKDGDMLLDTNGNPVFTYTGIESKTPEVMVDGKIIGFDFVSGYSWQSIIKGKFVSHDGKTTQEGYFTICNTNAGSPAYAIAEVVYFNNENGLYYSGTASTRSDGSGLDAIAIERLNSENSITKHMSEDYWQAGKTVTVGTTIDFKYAWMQHVSYDPDHDGQKEDNAQKSVKDHSVWYKTHQNDPSWWYNYRTTPDEIALNNQTLSAGSNMNYLHIYSTSGSDHNLDYNSSGAWGFNRQSETISFNGATYNKNGQLVTDGDFNNLVYSNSQEGNKFHDKWIIVYLEGDGYAGWYLGFDFEGAYDGTGADKLVGANGVCDDWIIKLAAVDPNHKDEACRIMCEDLGGINNEVTIGTTIHISDIDYNDIVLDVTPGSFNGQTTAVKLTLQAAGGTLPLTVWYKDRCLFETHEMFQKDAYYDDGDRDVDYSIMYNTDDPNAHITNTDSKDPKDIYLYFNVDNDYIWRENTGTAENPVWNGPVTGFAHRDATFDMANLHIRVWRHPVEDYKASKTNYSVADWINLTNFAGEAPLKICVPQTVKWLKERHAIHLGYPGFMDWVKKPSDYFWKEGKTINPEHLY